VCFGVFISVVLCLCFYKFYFLKCSLGKYAAESLPAFWCYLLRKSFTVYRVCALTIFYPSPWDVVKKVRSSVGEFLWMVHACKPDRKSIQYLSFQNSHAHLSLRRSGEIEGGFSSRIGTGFRKT